MIAPKAFDHGLVHCVSVEQHWTTVEISAPRVISMSLADFELNDGHCVALQDRSWCRWRLCLLVSNVDLIHPHDGCP